MRWFQKMCLHYISGFFSRSFEHFSSKLGVHHFWLHYVREFSVVRFKKSTPRCRTAAKRRAFAKPRWGAQTPERLAAFWPETHISLFEIQVLPYTSERRGRDRFKNYLLFVPRRKVWKYLPPMESTWHSYHFKMLALSQNWVLKPQNKFEFFETSFGKPLYFRGGGRVGG